MALPLNQDTIKTAPRDASTVMVLRDGTSGLEVLLVRRHAHSPVLGGAYVFPGGKVDPQDSLFPSERLSRADFDLQRGLAEADLAPTSARAIWVAAIRETFEECGLLLGVDLPDTFIADAVAAPLNRSLERLTQAHSLTLQVERLTPWTRWITPTRPSVTNKRFDTRIFMALCPTNQVARVDGHETTEVIWITPKQALLRYQKGQIDLAPVQLICLVHLLNFANAAHAFQSASDCPPRLIEPHPCEINGQRLICYPGDPLHSAHTAAWAGPTRLVYRASRFEPVNGFDHLFG
jgi:8-oxo-dGTP pyrophosphatase MutT (NUDIX family)